MGDVLEAYKRPSGEKQPAVCLDETGRQLIEKIKTPCPIRSGKPALYDYEYARNRVANLFMMFFHLHKKSDRLLTPFVINLLSSLSLFSFLTSVCPQSTN
jgi:hypothetical protein